jgi:type VI secretion system protein VasD
MKRVLAVAMALGLAGCGGPPPPPPPTVVQVVLTAAADANPTAAGQGAPVLLRIYQLASAVGFDGAEFFPLFNQDQATLGPDLINRDTLILPPGQSRTLTLTPPDTVKVVGVFAAYRDILHAIWRGTAAVVPHRTTRVTVLAGANGITVSAQPASPARPGSP